MGRGKVVHPQEETDPAGDLSADDLLLLGPVSPREQKAGGRSGGTHHHPALGPSVVGERWAVLGQLEAEDSDEKIDRGVILRDDDGNQVQVGHRLFVVIDCLHRPATPAANGPKPIRTA